MTTLVLLLGFLVLCVVGFGLGVWRMARRRRFDPPGVVDLPAAAPSNYRPMTRLFDGADLRYLRLQGGYRPAMTAHLRLERSAVLSLYLRQAHSDFRRAWSCCRELLPLSENPEFAPAMVKQFLTFYGLYAVLRLHCLLGTFVYFRIDVGRLLATLERLDVRARQAIGQQSRDLPAASAR